MNVASWIVLQDFPSTNGVIAAGSVGINFYNDFVLYVFATTENYLISIGIEELLANPDIFQPVWDRMA